MSDLKNPEVNNESVAASTDNQKNNENQEGGDREVERDPSTSDAQASARPSLRMTSSKGTMTAEATTASSAQDDSKSDQGESFGDMLSQYEKSHKRKSDESRQIEGTVVALTADSVLVDIGYKTEGILPLTAFESTGAPKVGDKLKVTVKGRDPEGYYELTRLKERRVTDWSSLEQAFADKATISGTITAVVKGGVSVDVGVRAFMPASRSGEKDAAKLEKLVGQEIRVRIIKLDVADEDVVVDRRAIAEDEERAVKDRRYSELKEGDVVTGEVRSLADYGAFVDLGGVDGLLHVGEISWSRVNKPGDVLTVGQQVEAKVLKIEPDKKRISLSMKQMAAHPWDAADKFKAGEKVRGTVTRIADFGAFVELEPGIEGLIHISEMSWGRKVRTPGDMVKVGDTVEGVILGVNLAERRMSLGLKQALGDPWAEAEKKFAAGTVIEGPVTNVMNFGAFVQLSEGVEGLVHISEMNAEKRINHPSEMVKVGQVVRAVIVAIDRDKRQVKLSMKQLVPTSIDEYIAEHKKGDTVTGRVMDVDGTTLRVELGEGIQATGKVAASAAAKDEAKGEAKADLSSLTSMLQSRWKGGAGSGPSKPEPVQVGQVRSFRITKLEPEAKKIEVEVA
jgi:small subunit ribosomal protein S1